MKLSKILLYLVAVAYPIFEFGHEKVLPLSYEGVGSLAFPIVILVLEIRKPKSFSVLAEILTGAIFATITQLGYLAVKGYHQESEEMQQMIRVDWTAMPFVLAWLFWLVRRRTFP